MNELNAIYFPFECDQKIGQCVADNGKKRLDWTRIIYFVAVKHK